MRFYGAFLLLLAVKFSDQSQGHLECYSCDDCDIMNHIGRIETCEVELERLVVAETLEDTETVRPEMTTDFMQEETEGLTMDTVTEVTEQIQEITDMNEMKEMNIEEMTTEEDHETTELLEETTTDFPERRLVKRSAGPISYCYKFLARSGEYFSSSS